MSFNKNVSLIIPRCNGSMGFSQELKIKSWILQSSSCSEIKIDYNVRIGKSKLREIYDSVQNIFSLINLRLETLSEK